MNTNTHSFVERRADESRVKATECGLLAASIAVTIIGAVSATGMSLITIYGYWSATVMAALQG